MVAGSAWLAEQAGERGDGFQQQRVDAGLLVGGVAGAELGDRAAVLGLGGKWRTRAATAGLTAGAAGRAVGMVSPG